ncbi:MAG: WD40 repeat domain-containing protein, partial [Planctomycetota bacterium]|nr:WD40 repeat domain-containing protein [Planctomycetota bacterium]
MAIATSGHNNIYIYRLADSGDAPLLRQFRGHGARVSSLSISADRRYLASASDDGTARIWNMEGLDTENPQLLRWGARFSVTDEQLIVSELRADSPLYFRGLRSGDTIRRLRWVEAPPTKAQVADANNGYRDTESPQEMIRHLEENDWRTPVTFTLTRGRNFEKSFQSVPAWQPLVSLVISTDREWAYWTPAGYYDASFEGHRLFGWQFNRGLYLMPDFFLAAQLRASLERPNVMSRLLNAGNLEDAFRLSHQESPASPEHAIVSAHRLRPHIQLLTPQPEQSVDGDKLDITAEIFVRTGQTLVPPKAFANGVVATHRVLRGIESVTRDNEQWQKHTYQWQAHLPHDPKLLIHVIASTDQELADEAT